MDKRISSSEELKSKVDVKVFNADQVVLEEGEICAVLEIEVRDKDGHLKQKWAKKAESFTCQFLDLLRLQLGMVAEIAPILVRDTLNTLRPLANSYLTFAINALVNDDTFSILVGTGATAPTITDFALEAKIAHGAGAGQLQYSLVTFGLPTATATQSYFTITRNFSNASAGSITVNEVGLYMKADQAAPWFSLNTQRVTFLFLTIRDVIGGGGIPLGVGETLTLNYRLISVV